MFDPTNHLPHTSLSKVWRGSVKRLDVDGMLVKSCDAMKFEAINSTTEHHMERTGSFALEPLESKLNFNSTVVY